MIQTECTFAYTSELRTHLEVARPGDVDDGGLLGVLLVLLARLLGD